MNPREQVLSSYGCDIIAVEREGFNPEFSAGGLEGGPAADYIIQTYIK